MDGAPHIVIGLDLGKIQHYSAFVVCAHDEAAQAMRVLHLERPPQGAPYRQVAKRLSALIKKASANVDPTAQQFGIRKNQPVIDVALDATGVGEPVLEMIFEEELYDATVFPLVMHGPCKPHVDEDTGRIIVAKADIIESLELRAQSDPSRFRCPPDLNTKPEGLVEAFFKELGALRAKLTQYGVRYEHDPDATDELEEASHGDLGVAACQASWVADHCGAGGVEWISLG